MGNKKIRLDNPFSHDFWHEYTPDLRELTAFRLGCWLQTLGVTWYHGWKRTHVELTPVDVDEQIEVALALLADQINMASLFEIRSAIAALRAVSDRYREVYSSGQRDDDGELIGQSDLEYRFRANWTRLRLSARYAMARAAEGISRFYELGVFFGSLFVAVVSDPAMRWFGGHIFSDPEADPAFLEGLRRVSNAIDRIGERRLTELPALDAFRQDICDDIQNLRSFNDRQVRRFPDRNFTVFWPSNGGAVFEAAAWHLRLVYNAVAGKVTADAPERPVWDGETLSFRGTTFSITKGDSTRPILDKFQTNQWFPSLNFSAEVHGDSERLKDAAKLLRDKCKEGKVPLMFSRKNLELSWNVSPASDAGGAAPKALGADADPVAPADQRPERAYP